MSESKAYALRITSTEYDLRRVVEEFVGYMGFTGGSGTGKDGRIIWGIDETKMSRPHVHLYWEICYGLTHERSRVKEFCKIHGIPPGNTGYSMKPLIWDRRREMMRYVCKPDHNQMSGKWGLDEDPEEVLEFMLELRDEYIENNNPANKIRFQQRVEREILNMVKGENLKWLEKNGDDYKSEAGALNKWLTKYIEHRKNECVPMMRKMICKAIIIYYRDEEKNVPNKFHMTNMINTIFIELGRWIASQGQTQIAEWEQVSELDKLAEWYCDPKQQNEWAGINF